MAVTSAPFTATDLTAVIPTIWPNLILRQMFAKAIAANWFTNLSDWMRDQGNSAKIPDVYSNAFSATSQSTQGAEVTTTDVAQNTITLNVNTHSYVAFLIGDKDARQILRSFDFNQVYIEKAAGALRNALEDLIFGLWSSLSVNTSLGSTAALMTDATMRQAIELLEALNFDTLDGDTGFFFHPYTFYVQLGAVAKYYDQSQRGPLSAAGFTQTGTLGDNQPNYQTGLRGTLYGIPVFVSSRIVQGLQTYRNLLARKEAFCYATQYQPSPFAQTEEDGRVRAQTQYALRNLGWLSVVDMIYGAVMMRDQAAVLLNANSSLIGS